MPSRPGQPHASLIGWLSLTQLISWGSVFYLFGLLLEPVEQDLGLSRAEASLAFSLGLLAEGLLAWPVGRWIDSGRERVVMTLGSLILASGLVLHSLIESRTGYYAVWLLLGAGLSATLYSPAFAVVIRRYPHDFRRAIIVITFLGGLASTVFLPLTAWLIAHLGWRHALWPLAALHLLVCAPIHALVLRQAPQPRAGPISTSKPGLRHHVLSAPYLLVGVFIVLLMGVTAALPAHMVSLLRSYGLAETWVIAVPATVGLLQVGGRALLFFFERHLNLHLVNRLIPCLIPLGLLILLLAPLAGTFQIALVVVFVVVYGMGNGMLTIVKGTAVAEYVDREQAASLNGALGLPMALGRAATPWLLGLMWTPQDAYTHGLLLMLVISVLGVLTLALAQRRART
jgi:MFS family permease